MLKRNFLEQIFILFLCVSLLLAYGCSNASSYEEKESEISLFPEYKYDERKAQYCADKGIAINKEGYYYKFNSMLYFYNIDKDISAPMCSRADCSHKTKDCDAYVTQGPRKKEANCTGNCIDERILYHNNYIYMIERDDDDKVYLARYDSSFNNREILLTLSSDFAFIYGAYGDSDRNCVIQGEYLYHFNCDCSKNVAENPDSGTIFCCRTKLEKGAKPEKLGEYNFDFGYTFFGSPTSAIYISGDTVYYISGGTEKWNAKEDNDQYRVASYNTKTNEFKIIMSYTEDKGDNAWGEGTGFVSYISADKTCMDSNDNLYIVSELDEKKCIVKFNMITKTSDVIYTSDYEQISEIMCDGEYIFLQEINENSSKPRIKEKAEARIAAIDSGGKLLASKDYEYDEEWIECKRERYEKNHYEYDENDLYPSIPEVDMRSVDDRYIMLMSYSYGVKGLVTGAFKDIPEDTNDYGTGIGVKGVGLINKADFLSGKDCEIKQIKKYWED